MSKILKAPKVKTVILSMNGEELQFIHDVEVELKLSDDGSILKIVLKDD